MRRYVVWTEGLKEQRKNVNVLKGALKWQTAPLCVSCVFEINPNICKHWIFSVYLQSWCITINKIVLHLSLMLNSTLKTWCSSLSVWSHQCVGVFLAWLYLFGSSRVIYSRLIQSDSLVPAWNQMLVYGDGPVDSCL